MNQVVYVNISNGIASEPWPQALRSYVVSHSYPVFFRGGFLLTKLPFVGQLQVAFNPIRAIGFEG